LHAEEVERILDLTDDEVVALMDGLRPAYADLHRQPLPSNAA
jgi:hypothetical protein